MKNNTCPKCGSSEIHAGIDVHPKSGPFTSNAIPISLTSVAALDNYVCTRCGYVESYVADTHKRQEISRKWPLAKTGDDE